MDSNQKFMGYAFLVGIGKFPHLKDYDRPGLAKESQKLETLLQNRGYQDINIWERSLSDPTNEQILYELRGFKFAIDKNPQAATNGTAFIYLATHGLIHENNYYLFTTNSKYLEDNKDKIDPSTCISDQSLFDICLTIPVKNLVLLLNTCYSGAAGSRTKLEDRIVGFLKERRSLVIIASSTQDQASWYHRKEEYSLFGRYLLQGLELGFVRIHLLSDYLAKNIKSENIAGKDQTPIITLGSYGNFDVALPDPDPDIDQILLGERPHYDYYSRPEFDQRLTDCLKNRKHILLIGPSLSGKSRAVHHALKELKLVSDIIPSSTLEPWRLGDSTYTQPKLLLLDDLHRLVKEPNFDPFFRAALANKHTIVAICRSGTDYQNVDHYFWENFDKNLKILFGDNIIRMPWVPEAEAEIIAQNTDYQWADVKDKFDHNIGSIFLPLKEMEHRFAQSSPEEITILRGLRKLYRCGIYEEQSIFPLKWLKPVVHKDDLNLKKFEWTAWLKKLQNKEFIKRESIDRIWAEEAYLEKIVEPEFDIPELTLFPKIIRIFLEAMEPKALLKAGNTLSDLGQYKEALEAYVKALKLDLTYVHAWNNKGNTLSDLGQYKEALEAYVQALKLDPTFVMALYNKGNALRYLGRHEEALEAYVQALKLDPTHVGACINKGIALRDLGRHEEALEAYVQALKLDPTYVMAWNNKGCTLSDLVRHEEALVAYDQALELDPTYVRAWFNKGITLRDLRQLEEALEAYNQALELDSTFVEAWNNKGIILSDLEWLEEALVAYDQALVLDPTYVRAWFNKGNTLRDLERLEEALEAYEQALVLDPTDVAAWNNKGITLRNLGQHEEALVAYERALALDSTYVVAWNNKGNSLRDLGQHEEALVAYERALDLDPTNVAAWNNKGISLKVLGRHEEALVAYERALAMDPTDVKALYNKGYALNALGRHEETLEAYEQVLKLDSTYIMAWTNKVDVLSKLGRYQEADQAYQRAKELSETQTDQTE